MKLCLMFKESVGIFPEMLSNPTVTSAGRSGGGEESSGFRSPIRTGRRPARPCC